MTSKKVLVCDDSPTDRIHLERLVAATGCSVISAGDGRAALEIARSQQPDLIFLDVMMPELDGYATCRALQSDPQTRSIPVVFVTSKQQKADRVWAQLQGGRGLIGKPFSTEEIAQQIRQCI